MTSLDLLVIASLATRRESETKLAGLTFARQQFHTARAGARST